MDRYGQVSGVRVIQSGSWGPSRARNLFLSVLLCAQLVSVRPVHAASIWACARDYTTFNRSKRPKFSVDWEGRLNLTVNDPSLPGIRALDHFFRLFRNELGLEDVSRIYQAVVSDSRPNISVFQKAIDAMGVKVESNLGFLSADGEIAGPGNVALIPSVGPLVITANHPLSGVDALALAAQVAGTRSDVKIMMNVAFEGIPELRDHAIFADPLNPEAPANRAAIRDALKWVKDGHILIIFPAGEVSSQRPGEPVARDPDWKEGAGRIAQKAGAPVMPVFIHGEPSSIFQLARSIKKTLASPLLLREIAGQKDSTVKITFGDPVPHSKIAKIEDPKELALYLKALTQVHSGNAGNAMRPERAAAQAKPSAWDPSKFEAIAPAGPLDKLVMEINGLGPEHLLISEGDYQIFVAKGSEIPEMMFEIGRQREITFRGVKEGSGKSTDTDSYDQYYRQLFVWDKVNQKLVGAYRMGLGDEILPAMGTQGFYNSKYFDLNKFVQKTGPNVIELGRTIVTPEYQKKSRSLFMLWRGIGEFVNRNPRYEGFFGPVGMSADYQQTSQQLLVQYLTDKHQPADMKGLVVSKNPPEFSTPLSVDEAKAIVRQTDDIKGISDLVQGIEPDGKATPVLFRQYLKWDGAFLSFLYEKDFNATAGFIYVDLRKADTDALGTYLGKEAVKQYKAHHAAKAQTGN